jgi:hypothetical protein
MYNLQDDGNRVILKLLLYGLWWDEFVSGGLWIC